MKNGPFQNKAGKIWGLLKNGIGWFLRGATFVEFGFILMIKPKSLS